MRLLLDESHESEILLSQTHIAATMTKNRQIVVADHQRLKYLFHHQHLCRYQLFGLKSHGNFTAYKIEPPTNCVKDQYEDVSYVQASLRFTNLHV